MLKRKLAPLACFLFIVLSLTGCTGGSTVPPVAVEETNAQLLRLLPAREGYQWLYNGFAEYGHTMRLMVVDRGANDYRYYITGTVHDMSDGESTKDFSLRLIYRIRDGVLLQQKSEQTMLDSDFNTLELLRSPLEKGAAWTQRQTDKTGAERELVCHISDIAEENGIKAYTIEYREKGSDYYEQRVIKEGIGVVSFEKLWQTPDTSAEIGYALNYEQTGYLNQLALDAFLPPLGKELRYFGLAEYAHTGRLQKISTDAESAVYRFDGEFQDGSALGGTFAVEYAFDYVGGTVTEKVLANSRTGRNEVNSRLHDLTILKLPLQTGEQWRSSVTLDGQTKEATARIVSIEYPSRSSFPPPPGAPESADPVVTVRYTVDGAAGYYRDTYVEERRFQAGLGMIAFTNLMPGDLGLSGKDADDPLKVEEAYWNHFFGYALGD